MHVKVNLSYLQLHEQFNGKPAKGQRSPRQQQLSSSWRRWPRQWTPNTLDGTGLPEDLSCSFLLKVSQKAWESEQAFISLVYSWCLRQSGAELGGKCSSVVMPTALCFAVQAWANWTTKCCASQRKCSSSSVNHCNCKTELTLHLVLILFFFPGHINHTAIPFSSFLSEKYSPLAGSFLWIPQSGERRQRSKQKWSRLWKPHKQSSNHPDSNIFEVFYTPGMFHSDQQWDMPGAATLKIDTRAS